jgi:hypothetical protein
MNYIILIHKPNFYEVMANLSEQLSERISIRKYGENLESELYISSLLDMDGCVRVHSPTVLVLEDYYEPDEIEDVISLIKEPDRFMISNMEYRNYDILRQSLEIISENVEECYIDNDFGTILSAYDFIKKWDDNPDWNWLKDLDGKTRSQTS